MSALQEIQQGQIGRAARSSAGGASAIDLHQVGPLFWAWYHQNPDRKIWTVKVWIVNKTFYVRDLAPVFTMLFGPDPT